MTEQPTFHLTEEQWAIVEQIKRQELTEQRLVYVEQLAQAAAVTELARVQIEAIHMAEERRTEDLRDRFAMCALTGMGAWSPSGIGMDYEARAHWAYAQADAMLKAREPTP